MKGAEVVETVSMSSNAGISLTHWLMHPSILPEPLHRSGRDVIIQLEHVNRYHLNISHKDLYFKFSNCYRSTSLCNIYSWSGTISNCILRAAHCELVRLDISSSILLRKFFPSILSHRTSLKLPPRFSHFRSFTS